MANISISQRGYDRKQFRTLTDINFKELTVQESTTQEDIQLQINNFFKQYDKLFFDIPNEGENSHTTLIQRSSEYVGDDIFASKDAQIENLNNEILSLQEQILNDSLSETGREHPFIKNGSFIRTKDSEGRPAPSVYFMEEGKKRLIKTYQLFLILKQGQGLIDKTDDEVIITLPQNIFKSIATGPNIEEENFSEPTTNNTQTNDTSVGSITISKGILNDRTNYNTSDVDLIENENYILSVTPNNFVKNTNDTDITVESSRTIEIYIEDFKGNITGTYKDEFGGNFYNENSLLYIRKAVLKNKDTGNIEQETIINNTAKSRVKLFKIPNIKYNYLIDIEYSGDADPIITQQTTSTTQSGGSGGSIPGIGINVQ